MFESTPLPPRKLFMEDRKVCLTFWVATLFPRLWEFGCRKKCKPSFFSVAPQTDDVLCFGKGVSLLFFLGIFFFFILRGGGGGGGDSCVKLLGVFGKFKWNQSCRKNFRFDLQQPHTYGGKWCFGWWFGNLYARSSSIRFHMSLFIWVKINQTFSRVAENLQPIISNKKGRSLYVETSAEKWSRCTLANSYYLS